MVSRGLRKHPQMDQLGSCAHSEPGKLPQRRQHHNSRSGSKAPVVAVGIDGGKDKGRV